ncbi:lysoplasmalogenase [Vibrio sp. SA48]
MWSWLSVALSGFISISALESNNIKQAVMFKTFSMLLLVTILLSQTNQLSSPMLWISLGLCVSAFADSLHVLQRYPRVCFTSFLLAQLMYSKAFWLQLSGAMVWWLPALLIAAGIVAFFLLLPQIDTLIFPVAIMGLMLIQLAWASGELWLQAHTMGALRGFVGSLVLILSALLLAIHDYRRPLPFGRYLISGSYLLAQALITASVVL